MISSAGLLPIDPISVFVLTCRSDCIETSLSLIGYKMVHNRDFGKKWKSDSRETFNKFRNSMSLLIQEPPNGIRYLKEQQCKTLTLSVDYLLPLWSTWLDKTKSLTLITSRYLVLALRPNERKTLVTIQLFLWFFWTHFFV